MYGLYGLMNGFIVNDSVRVVIKSIALRNVHHYAKLKFTHDFQFEFSYSFV